MRLGSFDIWMRIMTAGSDEVGEAAGKDASDCDHEDLEVEIYNAVRRRMAKSGGLPDREDIFAMEEPIYRLADAASLFCDLAFNAKEDDPPKPRSLVFLAKSMRRETGRLYQLLTGNNPVRE